MKRNDSSATRSTGGVSTRTSADETNSNATATSPNEIDRPDVASAHDAATRDPPNREPIAGKTETNAANAGSKRRGATRVRARVRANRTRRSRTNGESAATEFTVDADANVDSPAGARRRRALRDAGVDKSRGHGRNSSNRAREMAGVGEGGRGANLEQSAAGGGDDARGDLVHRLFGAVRERQLRRGRREETVRQSRSDAAEDGRGRRLAENQSGGNDARNAQGVTEGAARRGSGVANVDSRDGSAAGVAGSRAQGQCLHRLAELENDVESAVLHPQSAGSHREEPFAETALHVAHHLAVAPHHTGRRPRTQHARADARAKRHPKHRDGPQGCCLPRRGHHSLHRKCRRVQVLHVVVSIS